jgi:hypothetical protein
MNTIEFVKDIPASTVAAVFKDYFEQHMLVYDLLKGVDFVSLNDISINEASIMYSIKLNDENKDRLIKRFQSASASLMIYGKTYTPEIFLNGDLLCITIKK